MQERSYVQVLDGIYSKVSVTFHFENEKSNQNERKRNHEEKNLFNQENCSRGWRKAAGSERKGVLRLCELC